MVVWGLVGGEYYRGLLHLMICRTGLDVQGGVASRATLYSTCKSASHTPSLRVACNCTCEAHAMYYDVHVSSNLQRDLNPYNAPLFARYNNFNDM